MKFFIVLATLIMVVSVGTAQAGIYRYTDNQGGVHFVEDISKVPKKYRYQLRNTKPLKDISVIDSGPVSSQRKTEETPTRQTSSIGGNGVELFVTSWCGYCKKMEQFLKEKGIPYTSYDIENDDNAARRHRELGGGGVPLVRIGYHVVRGYKPDAVMSYIGK
jgi:glutaredoxin